jgi:hypothetical protein
MEKVSRTDRVRNEVLYRIKEDRNILNTIKRRKANWIGHILRRICLVKQFTAGKTEERIKVIL